MSKNILFSSFLIAVLSALFLSSCKKNNLYSTDNLNFSQDTVVFDTVFTTIGSITKQLKIYNPSKRQLKIDNIFLEGGSTSVFRINVDGQPGTHFSNITLEAKDSLYIFIEVTLDPNNSVNPMVIEDNIKFTTNGKEQTVVLAAWGQDAYFHYSYISQGLLDLNEGIWPNDKPHVIYGGAFVDSAKSLTIQAGTDIYLHKDALLYVYKGALNINGTLNNEVTLQGDRLESYYDEVNGQYYGIYFNKALPSTIDYAIIKNGTSGIHLFDEAPSNPSYTLTVTNTKIFNNQSYGIFVYSGAKVKAENCVIAKNGIHALLVLEGGDFNFNNCTLAGYGTGGNSASVLGISNYFTRNDDNGIPTTFIGDINEGNVTNSVIYGLMDQEIAIDTIGDPAITLSFLFEDNHIRAEEIPTSSIYQNNTFNSNPLFVNTGAYDFNIFQNSPLVNSANSSSATLTDILGNGRDASPDKGAYEYQ